MQTELSEYAQRSLERLRESWTANWCVRASILTGDPSPRDAMYSVNWRLYRALENFLGAQQVTHAADILNSYCQSILAEILKANPTVFTYFSGLKLGVGIKDANSAISVLASHRGSDGAVREALRDRIKCHWSPECDIIAKLRNKIVHQNGHDPSHEVEREIASKNGVWCDLPPSDLKPDSIPIRYADGDQLVMDAEIGHWACRHVENHIFLMDQNVCHVFKIPRSRSHPRPLPWSYTGGNVSPYPMGLGISLPTTPPETVTVKADPPSLSPAPDYSMAPINEKKCAQSWIALRKGIDEFIYKYTEDIGVVIRSRSHGIAGVMQGHTIEGHDMYLDYALVPKDDPHASKFENLGIRLRQHNFDPFVTVWGTHSMMLDVKTNILSEELKDVLRTNIGKTLTRLD